MLSLLVNINYAFDLAKEDGQIHRYKLIILKNCQIYPSLTVEMSILFIWMSLFLVLAG